MIGTYLYVFFYTFVILKIVDWVVGLRINEEEESIGLDLTQHGESGYTL